MADVYLYSNLRDDDYSVDDSEDHFTEDDCDGTEIDSDDSEEFTLRQALLPTLLAVAIVH